MLDKIKDLKNHWKASNPHVVFLIILFLGLRSHFVYEEPLYTLTLWSIYFGATLMFARKAPLVVVAGGLLLYEIVFYGMKQVPYIRAFPVDLFVVGLLLLGALRKHFDFRSRWSFRFTKQEWASLFVVAIPSIIVLSFYFYAHPEVAAQWPFPQLNPWWMPFFILVLAFINGLREEFLYRYVLQNLFNGALNPLWAITAQALAFGFLHFQHGFPQGWIGVFLTFLFGFSVGVQYYATRSIALAWLTHAFVDAAMFGIILYFRP